MTGADEYVPTMEDVRAAYAPPSDQPRKAERDAEFDRWLAAHDAEVAERAWDEGYTGGVTAHRQTSDACLWMPTRNPYRQEVTP